MANQYLRMGWKLWSATLLCLLLMTAFAAARDKVDGYVAILTKEEPIKVTVELANTPEDRAEGLMRRKSLPDRHGMLFDFGEARPVTFWMRETLISLDIIFIRDDQTIAHIHRNAKPLDETQIPSPEPVRWVLEVMATTLDETGMAVGDKVVYRPNNK